MPRRCLALTLTALISLSWSAAAQEAGHGASEAPVLRLEGDGPLSPVQGVAFSPNGATLYEVGWDKVVRVWQRDATNGRFALDPAASLRTPIGPGDLGVLNALAVSPDGAWLAVGGNAVIKSMAGFRQLGIRIPVASVDPLDRGVIYVFNLRVAPAKAYRLVGHRGPVTELTFVDTPAGRPPRLLSAGPEGTPARLSLRLWDVTGRFQLGSAFAGKVQPLRNYVAAWSLPPDHTRVRAAVASDEGGPLLWDASGDMVRLADPFGGATLLLTYQRDSGRLLTGHVDRAYQPGLATWHASGPLPPAATVDRRRLPAAGDRPQAVALPCGQALLASRPGGPPDLLAVVTRGTDGAYRLTVLDLAPATFLAVRAQSALWSGNGSYPFAVSSGDGSRLAVVGSPRNEILVFEAAGLLARPAAPPQRLRGEAEPLGAVAFVKNGGDRGLGFSRTDTGRGPDLVFDVTNRRFERSPVGWQSAAPAGAWRTVREEQSVRVEEGPRPVGRIDVFPENTTSLNRAVAVTAHAVRPAAAPADDPVVAVALVEDGVGPSLWLYNGRSGERFRGLTGHSAAVRSLSFSDDGQLLVSSADDHTANVWSLIDLDHILRARGGLPGLELEDQGGQVVLSKVVRNLSRGEVDLRPGDVVEGFVEGGRVVPVASAIEYHLKAAGWQPGRAVTLRRRRGVETRDVALVLGQAADERKPLFTFFAKPAAQGAPDWLAWSPFGPYDSSGPGVESTFGWHFNDAANPEVPAWFAGAGQYREYRREGLVLELMNLGRLVPRIEPAAIKPPRMELFPETRGVTDGTGNLVVRRPPTRLALEVDEPVPAERVESVTWQVDGGPTRPMQAGAAFWEADLTNAGLVWDRKPRMITVTLKTRGPESQTFRTSRTWLYRPPAPRLIVREPAGLAGAATGGFETKQKTFRIAADVVPTGDEKVRVRLVSRHEGGEPQVIERDVPAVDETIELKPGNTTIELEAYNAGAVGGTDGEEVTRLGPLTVYFRPEPVKPPTIRLDSLVLLPDSPDETETSRPMRAQDASIVDVSRIRLEGEIGGKATLSDWQVAAAEVARDGLPWKPLDGFEPGREAFSLKQEIALTPGRQRIYLRAQGADKTPEATPVVTLEVDYHPRVPKLEALKAEFVDAPEKPGADPTRVKLSARIVGDAIRFPIDSAAVLVDGVPASEQPRIDREAGKLTALVTLHTGPNEVMVRIGNHWSQPASFGPIEPRPSFSRPPIIEEVRADRRGSEGIVTVSARATSVTALSRAEVVHRSPTAPADRPPIPLTRGADGVLTTPDGVVLDPGENEFIVRLANTDGESQPRSQVVAFASPEVVKAAEVIMESPESPVAWPDYELRFRVLSRSPLTSVELIRARGAGRQPVARFEVPREPRADGVFELVGRAELILAPLENSFELRAVNAGGASRRSITLCYTPPPASLEIIDLVPEGGDVRPIPPASQSGGPPRLAEPLPGGRATLRGRVVWKDTAAMRAYDRDRLQIWVNGFPQSVADLDAPQGGGRARTFEAAVALSRFKDNEIRVKLRGRPLDVRGDPRLLADCQAPDRSFRLHLLAIGVGVPEAGKQALLSDAVASVNGHWKGSGDEFQTAAFAQGHLYGPVYGRCEKEQLYAQIHAIQMRLGLSFEPSNDVVMIYYQGGQIVEDRKHGPSLLLQPGSKSVLPLKWLGEFLAPTRGAKLLLFDVAHPTDREPEMLAGLHWLDEDLASSFALLRVSWPRRSPPDTNLGTMLRSALQERPVANAPREGPVTLGEAARQVDRQAAELREGRFPGLRFIPELNPFLEKLVIGGAR